MRWVARCSGTGAREGGGGVVEAERIGGVPVERDARRRLRGSCRASEDIVDV